MCVGCVCVSVFGCVGRVRVRVCVGCVCECVLGVRVSVCWVACECVLGVCVSVCWVIV